MTAPRAFVRLGVALAAAALVGCSGGSGGETSEVAPEVETSPTEVTVAPTDAPAPTPTADSAAPTATDAPMEPPGTIVEVGASSIDPADIATASLSAAQQRHLDDAGRPDRFEITFLTDTLPDGTPVDIRHETWHDDSAGIATVYRNGDLFTQRDAGEPLTIDSMGSTPYRAEWFTATMTLDELLAVTDQTAYYAIPVDPAIDGGTLVTVQGLMAGFENETLRFVQTVPLVRGDS